MFGSSEQSFDNHAGYVFVVAPRLLPDFSRRRRKVVTPNCDESLGRVVGRLGLVLNLCRVCRGRMAESRSSWVHKLALVSSSVIEAGRQILIGPSLRRRPA